jgi:hypothetical protein
MSKSLNSFFRCAHTRLDLRKPDLENWPRVAAALVLPLIWLPQVSHATTG